MREIIPLNHGWLYTRASQPAETVSLPHANVLLPYNYFDEKAYQFVSTYQRTLHAPLEWQGRRVFLRFEGVMAAAEVYVDGSLVGAHLGGYTPFDVELTTFLTYGADQQLLVRVDSTERADFPPCGNVVDYLTYGGIYREVSLEVTAPDFIRELRLSPRKTGQGESVQVELAFGGALAKDAEVRVWLSGHGVQEQLVGSAPLGADRLQLAFAQAEGLRHWSPDDPALYQVRAELWQGGAPVDELSTRFGMRFCEFRPDGFYLNGVKTKLTGLNRHQSYPYVGGAMPKRVQRRDADLLKELGANIARTSHYPQSRHFLDRCDELGLMVFEEIPGWQHIGDEAWRSVAVQSVEEMIRRDYNHPAIVLWGVRINESEDRFDFYRLTNELAHRLDSTRQTGGVRAHVRGDFQEDVFTFNEFIHNGGELIFRKREEITGLDRPVPLLVTENNGHMYPTKRFDTESRLVEHAMRHLRVRNEALGREDIVGEIAWCAFDYNTHGSFGSGDKICYHGVADMYRIPKYAGLALMSQRPLEAGAMLEPLSLISRGELDGGGIMPFWIATNCDCVRVYRNGVLVDDFLPRRALFPNLPHPPVLVNHLTPKAFKLPIADELMEEYARFIARQAEKLNFLDLTDEDYAYLESLSERAGLERGALAGRLFEFGGGWGREENNFRLEGLVNGETVIVREAGETKSFARLALEADDDALRAHDDTYDATRIVVRALDTYGNLCPFYAAGFTIETNGVVEIIGPTNVALIGGCLAFWVKTCGKTGEASVRVESGQASAEIKIAVR